MTLVSSCRLPKKALILSAYKQDHINQHINYILMTICNWQFWSTWNKKLAKTYLCFLLNCYIYLRASSSRTLASNSLLGGYFGKLKGSQGSGFVVKNWNEAGWIIKILKFCQSLSNHGHSGSIASKWMKRTDKRNNQDKAPRKHCRQISVWQHKTVQLG